MSGFRHTALRNIERDPPRTPPRMRPPQLAYRRLGLRLRPVPLLPALLSRRAIPSSMNPRKEEGGHRERPRDAACAPPPWPAAPCALPDALDRAMRSPLRRRALVASAGLQLVWFFCNAAE